MISLKEVIYLKSKLKEGYKIVRNENGVLKSLFVRSDHTAWVIYSRDHWAYPPIHRVDKYLAIFGGPLCVFDQLIKAVIFLAKTQAPLIDVDVEIWKCIYQPISNPATEAYMIRGFCPRTFKFMSSKDLIKLVRHPDVCVSGYTPPWTSYARRVKLV